MQYVTPTGSDSSQYSGSESDSSYGTDVEHEDDLDALMEAYGDPSSPYVHLNAL